jgi:hypothetical protein
MNDRGDNTLIRKSSKVLFMPNREVRRVPLDWEHPKDGAGNYIPLFARDYYTPEEISYLLAQGRIREEIQISLIADFGKVPDEKMGICVYETTTEGTPLSPVFPDTEPGRIALVRYCAVNVPAFAYYYVHARTWTQVLFGKDLMLFDLVEGDFDRAAESGKES